MNHSVLMVGLPTLALSVATIASPGGHKARQQVGCKTVGGHGRPVRPRGTPASILRARRLLSARDLISVSAVKIQACLPFGADGKRAKRTRTHFYYAWQKTITLGKKTDDMRPRLKRCIAKVRRGK
jgi:hypothetical protein